MQEVKVQELIDCACEAQELFPLDELEAWSEKLKSEFREVDGEDDWDIYLATEVPYGPYGKKGQRGGDEDRTERG